MEEEEMGEEEENGTHCMFCCRECLDPLELGEMGDCPYCGQTTLLTAVDLDMVSLAEESVLHEAIGEKMTLPDEILSPFAEAVFELDLEELKKMQYDFDCCKHEDGYLVCIWDPQAKMCSHTASSLLGVSQEWLARLIKRGMFPQATRCDNPDLVDESAWCIRLGDVKHLLSEWDLPRPWEASWMFGVRQKIDEMVDTLLDIGDVCGVPFELGLEYPNWTMDMLLIAREKAAMGVEYEPLNKIDKITYENIRRHILLRNAERIEVPEIRCGLRAYIMDVNTSFAVSVNLRETEEAENEERTAAAASVLVAAITACVEELGVSAEVWMLRDSKAICIQGDLASEDSEDNDDEGAGDGLPDLPWNKLFPDNMPIH